jgi:hypothetical protein
MIKPVAICSFCKKAYAMEDFKKLPVPRKGGTQILEYGDVLLYRNCPCHDPPTTLCALETQTQTSRAS